MKNKNNNEILFLISKETVQHEALNTIGRKLTDDELEIAKKGLEWGLTTDIQTVYNTIFHEMINQ